MNTTCAIKTAKWFVNKERTRLRFQITADRFLHGMVRLLVGNQLEIGYGRLSITEFTTSLKERRAPKFFNAAYPQGLFLSKVNYPFLERPSLSVFPGTECIWLDLQ